MVKRRRPRLTSEAARRNLQHLTLLGDDVRTSRRRRRLSQRALAVRAGVGQATVSRLERGRGGGLTLDAWQRIAMALGRDLEVRLSRDPIAEPADAGHLAVQELILRMAAKAGFQGRFEMATRGAEPARSADIGLRDERRRCLVLVEAWNTFGDLGAAGRSTDRKVAEAEQLAIATGGGKPYSVRSCWVVRATMRNRTLVARYPSIFATRFPGSSVGWVRALTLGTEPPSEPGLIWCDVGTTRLLAWRRR
jgi:transcriptional regulator with XRE-family HTH domain